MSAIDDYEEKLEWAARMRLEAGNMLKHLPDSLELKGASRDLKGIISDLIQKHGAMLVAEAVDAEVIRAKTDAIEECCSFLRENATEEVFKRIFVEQVMET